MSHDRRTALDPYDRPADRRNGRTRWPGKTTLVDGLQLRRAAAGAVPARGSREEREAATAGVEASGAPLPHLSTIQAAFGPDHDLSGVRAHVGPAAAGACETLGADAYATGRQVAFASAPSLHLAAHEAAHVVQQGGGVHLAGGAGDPHEREADSVADAVVSGTSAAPLLAHYAGGTAHDSAVQKQDAKDPRAPKPKQSTPGEDLVHDLSKEERDTILAALDGTLLMAYCDYSTGAQQAKADILKEMQEADKQNELALVFVEVGVGLLFPGFGKLASGLINRLPPNTPNAIYQAAYAMLENDRLEKGLDAVLGKAGDAAKKEILAAMATPTGGFDAFINNLIFSMKQHIVGLIVLVRHMPDEAMMATLAAYYNTGIEDYKQKILASARNYMKQVAPIRKGAQYFSEYGYAGVGQHIACRIDLGGDAKREATVWKLDSSSMGGQSTGYSFKAWITDDMLPQVTSDPESLPVVAAAKVDGIDEKEAARMRAECLDRWRKGVKKEDRPEAVRILRGVRSVFEAIDAMGRKDGAVTAEDLNAFANRKETGRGGFDNAVFAAKEACKALKDSPYLFRFAETSSLRNAPDGWLSAGDLDAAIKRLGG